MKTILFDLDGTLLPMNQKLFTERYLYGLAEFVAPYGFEPQAIISNVWKGTGAMIQNDGTMTNEERFWQVFHSLTGRGSPEDRELFLKFYETEFDKVKESCGFNPESARLIYDLKQRGDRLILATNPLFPNEATMRRIAWAGLDPDDFLMITTYENMNTCKPNPEYYRELCRKCGTEPDGCMLVGNDAVEDAAALKTGMEVFLITDCLENGREEELSVPHGSFPEVRRWLGL